jgi:hypothetical protein
MTQVLTHRKMSALRSMNIFKVQSAHLSSEFSKLLDARGQNHIFYAPPFLPLYQEVNPKEKNVLIWLATHFQNDEFMILSPVCSTWSGSHFFCYLQALGYLEYKNIFVVFNVCYSKRFSNSFWGDFVDMKAGMTLVRASRHFFMHKHMIPIYDDHNAAQRIVACDQSQVVLEASQRARRSVSTFIRSGHAMPDNMSDEIFEYVYIPNPDGLKTDFSSREGFLSRFPLPRWIMRHTENGQTVWTGHN